MTNRQTSNIHKLVSFTNNIGKLKVGLSTKFNKVLPSGETVNYGKVTCTTRGIRPRKFMVSGSSVIPNGTDYTYKTLMKNICDRFLF